MTKSWVASEITKQRPLSTDMQRDILEQMEFTPLVRNVKMRDERIFRDAPMGLRTALLALPLAARFKYDAEKHLLFPNFEKLEVETLADVERIRENVEHLCEPLGGGSVEERCRFRIAVKAVRRSRRN